MVVAVAACSPKPTPVAVHATSADLAAPVAREPAREDMTGTRPRKMANCPSAVPGARTAMAETEDGVDLLISGTTPSARDEIRRLAHVHARMGAPAALGLHSGHHTGGGRIGYCPIVHTGGAAVSVEDVASGVRVHLRATGREAISALRAQVARRVAGARAAG